MDDGTIDKQMLHIWVVREMLMHLFPDQLSHQLNGWSQEVCQGGRFVHSALESPLCDLQAAATGQPSANRAFRAINRQAVRAVATLFSWTALSWANQVHFRCPLNH